MSKFVEVKTAELVGPALDWAVANATEAWEFAHEWFPTMTLDPRFIGIRNVAVDGCVWLEPRNPFRQDPQPFRPSTDWAQGGPLLDEYDIALNGGVADGERVIYATLRAVADDAPFATATGPTRLIALCRAIVAAKLGDVVQVPAELVGVAA